jgi:hypothetical protein
MMEYLVITRVDHSLSVDFGKVGFRFSLIAQRSGCHGSARYLQ